jgi:hypothetical protein
MSKEVSNDKGWSYNGYKKLEELFSWATFYEIYRNKEASKKIQIEIEKQRIILGFK